MSAGGIILLVGAAIVGFGVLLIGIIILLAYFGVFSTGKTPSDPTKPPVDPDNGNPDQGTLSQVETTSTTNYSYTGPLGFKKFRYYSESDNVSLVAKTETYIDSRGYPVNEPAHFFQYNGDTGYVNYVSWLINFKKSKKHTTYLKIDHADGTNSYTMNPKIQNQGLSISYNSSKDKSFGDLAVRKGDLIYIYTDDPGYQFSSENSYFKIRVKDATDPSPPNDQPTMNFYANYTINVGFKEHQQVSWGNDKTVTTNSFLLTAKDDGSVTYTGSEQVTLSPVFSLCTGGSSSIAYVISAGTQTVELSSVKNCDKNCDNCGAGLQKCVKSNGVYISSCTTSSSTNTNILKNFVAYMYLNDKDVHTINPNSYMTLNYSSITS